MTATSRSKVVTFSATPDAEHRIACHCLKCERMYGYARNSVIWYCEDCLPNQYRDMNKKLVVLREPRP